MRLNKLNEVNSAELFIWFCYSEEVANLRQEKKKKDNVSVANMGPQTFGLFL